MRYLGMHAQSQSEWLEIINQSQYKDVTVDTYNQGPLVTLLEHRVAELVGKPAAMYFNKGTTCQLALMKSVCEAKSNNRVVLHPQSHIAFDEQDAFRALMGLEGVLLGDVGKPFDANDLESVSSEVSVLVVELPLRRAGFKLTPWDELIKMRQWCDEHGVHFHMDGARLWESAPFYQASVNEKVTFESIAALFDSVYVSLYKGVGATSGALLLGDESLLSSCAVWRDRLGSNMWTAFPALITALEGLDQNLPKIPECVSRAEKIAEILTEFSALKVDKPECHAFQIVVQAPLENINKELDLCQQQFDMVLCKPFVAIVDAKDGGNEWLYTEIQVGVDHALISDVEIEMFFTALLSAIEPGDCAVEWS